MNEDEAKLQQDKERFIMRITDSRLVVELFQKLTAENKELKLKLEQKEKELKNQKVINSGWMKLLTLQNRELRELENEIKELKNDFKKL